MTLTKAHIVEKLFAQNIFTKGESAHIIETLFEIVKQTLEEGDDVLISGFGKFTVNEKNQRRGGIRRRVSPSRFLVDES
jgi:integration host factor subunit alpha